MKRNRLLNLWALFIAMAISSLSYAQNPLVTGEGTASVAAPITFNYYHSYTQTIYLASELAGIDGKEVTKLGYQAKNKREVAENIVVYMGYTDKSSFAGTTLSEWVPFENLVQYYNGSFPFGDDNSVELILNTPFTYDSTKGNLVIAVHTPTKRAWYQNLEFNATSKGSNRVLIYRNDSSNFNPASPVAPSTSSANLPNTKFFYLVEGSELSLSPGTLNIEAEEGREPVVGSVTLSNSGTEDLVITGLTGLAAPFSTTFTGATIPSAGSLDIQFSLATDNVGEYEQTIGFLSNAGNNDAVSLTLKGDVYPKNSRPLIIGDGHVSSQAVNVPIHMNYRYSYSQTIYLQSEMAYIAGKRVMKVAFELASIPGNLAVLEGGIALYLGETEKENFPAKTADQWVDPASLTLYYEGTPTYSTTAPYMMEFELDMPYVYDGTKNLVVALYTTERRGTNSNISFFATPSTPSNRCAQYRNDNTNFDINAPAGIDSQFTNIPNISLYYDDLADGAEIVFSPKIIDFGYVEAGTNTTKELNVKNSGTQNLLLNAVTGLEAPFSSSFSGTKTLEPLGNLVVPFSFSPTAAGEFELEGLSFDHNAENTAIFTLKGNAYPQGSLFESFEGEQFPPNYWRTTNTAWTRNTNSYHLSQAATLVSAADTLITPLVKNEFKLFAKQSASGGKLVILYSTDLVNWTTALEETTLTADYTQYTVNIPSAAFVGITGTKMIIDLVQAEVLTLPEKDLFLTSWTVPTGLKENTNVDISVNIKNWGKTSEATYNILLKDGETNETLVTLPGEEIAPLEEKTLTINWNPQPEVNVIYAEVVLTGDADATNNRSKMETISVTPYLGVLQITPSGTIDLGLLKTYTETNQVQLTIKNTGIAQLIISEKTEAAPFSFDVRVPSSLDPNEEDFITVTFGPYSEPGVYEQELVIKHDGVGGETRIPVRGELLKKGNLFEDFNGEDFPPFMWSMTEGTKWSRHTGSHKYEGTGAAYYNNNNEPGRLISPKLDVKANDNISFYARHWTTASRYESLYLKILTSPDMETWTEIDELTIDDLTSSYKPFSVTLPEAGELYIAFEAQTEVFVDLIQGPQVIYPEHDLAVRSFVGPTTGKANNELLYTLTIRNQGTMDESEYSVHLMNGDELLAVYPGIELATLEAMEFPISWIPREAGSYTLTAKIISESDSDMLNNTSAELNVEVKVENSLEIEIGKYFINVDTNTIQTDIPFSRMYEYGLSEILFLADELNMPTGTLLTEMGYRYYMSSPLKDHNIPLRIWIGETELNDFSETMVQTEDMTLVFDNTQLFTYDSNNNTHTKPNTTWIEFETPVVYNGGNLVVLVEKDQIGEENGRPYIYFFQNWAENTPRTLTYTAKSEPAINPEETMDYELITKLSMGRYPVTLFRGNTPGVSLSGILHNEADEAFVGLNVELSSGNVLYEAVSDETGAFSMELFALDRDYTLSINPGENFDIYTQTVPVANEDIDLGTIVLEKISENCIFTLAVTANTGESLENVPVVLENNRTGMIYRRNLPVDGVIEFGSIKKDTYTLTISKEGLEPYNNTELLLDRNKIRLEVELLEEIVSPYGLTADVEYSEQTGKGIVYFEWNSDLDAFYDDFEQHEDFSISFSPWTGIDGDKGVPIQMDISYPNAMTPQYAIIFNPLNTSPTRWGYPSLMPYSGYKCVAFLRSANLPNNDWLIAPKKLIKKGDIVSFMARANGVNFSEENFRVAVSTTGNTNISDFTVISAGNNEAVGGTWTKFQYDLSNYAGQEIYVAINYTSVFKQMLFIDDFYLGLPVEKSAAKAKRVPAYAKAKAGNYPEYVIYLDGEEKGRTSSNFFILDEVDGGDRQLGVKAVYRTTETEIVPLNVVVDGLDKFASITANLTTDNNKSVDGINVFLSNSTEGMVYEKRVAQGKVEIPFARKGNYSLTIDAEGYETYTEDFALEADKVLDIQLKEIVGTPYNLTVDLTFDKENNTFDADFRWNQELGWRDGFEAYTDFATNFSPWTCHDLDNGMPWGLRVLVDGSAYDINYPGADNSAPKIFNPSATTPAIDILYDAYAPEGEKYLAFFSAGGDGGIKQSNDWAITPQLEVKKDYVLTFDLKAYPVQGVNDYYEVIKVLVSETTNDISSFKEIYTIKPSNQNWTRCEIDMAEYVGKDIYIAFNYASYDAFIVQLDNVYLGPLTSNMPIGSPLEYEVYLDDVFQGKLSENKYTFKQLYASKTYTAGVKAIYASGETALATLMFTTPPIVSIDDINGGEIKIYPTHIAEGYFNVVSKTPIDRLTIYNINGQVVKGMEMDKQTSFEVDVNELSMGVYYVQLLSGDTRTTEKIIIVK